MMRATETAMTAAHGPISTAMSVAPVMWAVVPPGSGMVKIIATKLKAEAMARNGTCEVSKSCFTLLDA
jgi:hypothetical protein